MVNEDLVVKLATEMLRVTDGVFNEHRQLTPADVLHAHAVLIANILVKHVGSPSSDRKQIDGELMDSVMEMIILRAGQTIERSFPDLIAPDLSAQLRKLEGEQAQERPPTIN